MRDQRRFTRTAHLPSESELLRYLERLNDDGTDPTVAGLDALGHPFLAMLRGAYADEHVVLFNTPWDGESETIRGYRCTECNAQQPATFADLAFPIILLQRVSR